MNILYRIIVVVLSSLIFIACDKSNDEFNDEIGINTENPLVKRMIGTYSKPSNFSYKQPYIYYYLSDGNGYIEQKESYDGVYRRAFTWRINNDKLIMTYAYDEYYGDFEQIYTISFDSEGNLTLIDSKNKSVVYSKINNNTTTSVKFKEAPFVNYIRIYGIYYSLSYVSMKCDHATGTGANMKHLMFFGANGSMEPIGARFMYSTPYYEGIDKYWSEGTYRIQQKSGYWIYGGIYCYAKYWNERSNGTLKIKRTNNIMELDFNLDNGDAIGHYVGTID